MTNLTAPPASGGTAALIDGRAASLALRDGIAAEVARLLDATGIVPGLAVVLVGEDPASDVYVRNKGRQAREVGMTSFEHRLPDSTSQADLLALVARLNADPAVHGILVQMPLPAQISAEAVIAAIAPEKDVDGFHIHNAGRLATGQPALVPCTPQGCLILLRDRLGPLDGMHAVIVGRSNIVGKPLAQLLLAANCTVSVAHSRTRDLPALCRQADILIAAVGRPEMILGDWVKPGATVIDVGINRVEREGRTRLVGDVDFAGAATRAAAITPVPGGVGPMTIACLLANTLAACRAQTGQPPTLPLPGDHP
ncbi:bifunctional methylenetetrahydrofolate dehydrogenase/methenyltetrahydrofolate cyclohydrolase FolD [Frigidibacter sp. MR17.14]|uniref:bifunctional methylenetetrahydrofolate dehydrogenase/methenyltetrahydrofolate cyclohydrolase FolD n=1 Tax=Frigidibacter sp. MR17.14 TaxID=3126509 RepID=UPI003012DDF1